MRGNHTLVFLSLFFFLLSPSLKKTNNKILKKKKNLQREPTVEEMKKRIKSMIWNIRKKKNIQSEQQEEKRIQTSKQTNKDRLRSLWDNFNIPTLE